MRDVTYNRLPWYLGYMWENHTIRCQIWVPIPFNWIVPKIYFWWMKAISGLDNAVSVAYHDGYSHGREDMLSDIKAGFQKIVDK